MKKFVPCQGKNACRDDGNRCLTCGRDLHEIEHLRQAMDQLASLAMTYDYENVDDYSDYIAGKLKKMVAWRRENP